MLECRAQPGGANARQTGLAGRPKLCCNAKAQLQEATMLIGHMRLRERDNL